MSTVDTNSSILAIAVSIGAVANQLTEMSKQDRFTDHKKALEHASDAMSEAETILRRNTSDPTKPRNLRCQRESDRKT